LLLLETVLAAVIAFIVSYFTYKNPITTSWTSNYKFIIKLRNHTNISAQHDQHVPLRSSNGMSMIGNNNRDNHPTNLTGIAINDPQLQSQDRISTQQPDLCSCNGVDFSDKHVYEFTNRICLEVRVSHQERRWVG
jgi:hypothetical protein